MFEAAHQGGIYAILNELNGKCYIGSTQNFKARRTQHFNALRGGRHHSKHLQAAWVKHGESAFVFIPLLTVMNHADLMEFEQRIMDEYSASDHRFGYNSRPVAESNRGHTFSAEMREKVRRANLGKRHSPETRERMSASHAGVKKTAEHAKNIAIGKTGIPRPDVSTWAPTLFAKLDNIQADALRADREAGMTFRRLAEKYGCSPATAHRVITSGGICYGANDV